MFNVPDDKLPDFARDDERVSILFSPLRTRTVNPKDWDSKVSSWKTLIGLYCTNNSIYSFSLASLNRAFVRHGRPPSCLDTVLQEMVKNGEVQLLQDFLKDNPKTWVGWATNLLVQRPVNWGLNSIKKSLFSINSEEIYVPLEVVATDSNKLFCNFPDKFRNKLMNFTHFLDIIEKPHHQAFNIKLLLHNLMKERKIDTANVADGDNMILIKIGDLNKLIPITEADIAIYTLEENEKHLQEHIGNLEDEMEECRQQAKTHLTKNHRQLAKTCLRKKHEIDKRLEKKIQALHNIQIMLEKIRDAHQNAKVWKSYENALVAFNKTYRETGMNEDAVEDTMFKLKETLDVHNEIEFAISQPVADETDEDLEQELVELLNESESTALGAGDALEKEMAKLDLNIILPDVPSPNISATQVGL